MSINRNIIRATLSGLLLCLPWYESFSVLFLGIALVPLLLLEDSWLKSQLKNTRTPVFLYASLTFLIWNTGTTWWIANASLAGCCAAILINTLLYSCLFVLFHLTRKHAGDVIGYIALAAFWIAFEYFYLNAEISWPWLNLGNGFAHNIKLIQWYEYTGTLGGTLWVLLINILIVNIIIHYRATHFTSKLYILLAVCAFVIAVPITISQYLYIHYHEKENPCRIAVIQPNVNPYDNSHSIPQQCQNLIHLADSVGDQKTQYFVAPEVVIEDNVWENNFENNFSVPRFQDFMHNYPNAHFIYGSYTYKRFDSNEPQSATAQYTKASDFYYDSYNSAIQVDTSKHIQVYHKSKLVVGIEKMPYPHALRFLKNIVERFGGSFASHGTQDFRSVLTSENRNVKVAPVICYESIYGEYVTNYVKNGANIIFVITNDGWWSNTPGHRQHLSYSRLRAIETRRSIARSANTGVSAFINQRGEIIKSLGWGIRGGIVSSLNTNSTETFYVKHGDYLGTAANMVSGSILIILLFVFIRKKIS